MKTVFYYQAEVIELDYTDKFHAYIEFESIDGGLQCKISLADSNNDDEFHIGSITSPDYDIESMHRFAENMLNNRAYINDIWRQEKRENRRKNAARR